MLLDCIESFQKQKQKCTEKKVYKICLTNLAISTLSTLYVRGTCENLQQFLEQKTKKRRKTKLKRIIMATHPSIHAATERERERVGNWY